MHLEIRGRFRPAEVPPAVHSTSLKRGRSSVRDHATRPAEYSPRSTEQTVDRAREHALSRPPNEAKIEMECKSFIGALLSGSGLKEDSEKQAYTACFRPPLTNSYYSVSHLLYKIFRSFCTQNRLDFRPVLTGDFEPFQRRFRCRFDPRILRRSWPGNERSTTSIDTRWTARSDRFQWRISRFI